MSDDNYALTAERLPARYAAHGEEDQGPQLRAYLDEIGTTAEAIIIALLGELDVASTLLAAGLRADQLAACAAGSWAEPTEATLPGARQPPTVGSGLQRGVAGCTPT